MPIDIAFETMADIATVMLPVMIVFLVLAMIFRERSRRTRRVILGRRSGRSRYGRSGISHTFDLSKAPVFWDDDTRNDSPSTGTGGDPE
jgi:hypothetical protein